MAGALYLDSPSWQQFQGRNRGNDPGELIQQMEEKCARLHPVPTEIVPINKDEDRRFDLPDANDAALRTSIAVQSKTFAPRTARESAPVRHSIEEPRTNPRYAFGGDRVGGAIHGIRKATS